jgi:glycosyltransferase involved in cell wall biosynthesis
MTRRPVLIVSRIMPFHSHGGMQFVAWDLARTLARLGTPVNLLTTRIPHREARFMEDGVQVAALEHTTPGRYSRAWWRESRRWFRTSCADVRAVLSVSAGAYGMLADRPRFPHVRFVMQAHGSSVGEIRSKWRTRSPSLWLRSVRNIGWLGRDLAAYGKFDRIVAVGPRVHEQLRSRPLSRFVPEGKLLLIENGVDTSRFRPEPALRTEVRTSLGWGPNDLVVATVSRLHSQKGVLEALRGFADFVRRRDAGTPPCRYLVVGDGPERGRLEKEASRLLPTESVKFLGDVVRERVPAFLNASDQFLFTTLHLEGLPLNVLEAAAVGLPLVLSSTLSDGLDLPGPIRFVDPVKPDDISAALEAMLQSPGLAAPESRPPALPERYTLECSAERYAEVLFPSG